MNSSRRMVQSQFLIAFIFCWEEGRGGFRYGVPVKDIVLGDHKLVVVARVNVEVVAELGLRVVREVVGLAGEVGLCHWGQVVGK